MLQISFLVACCKLVGLQERVRAIDGSFQLNLNSSLGDEPMRSCKVSMRGPILNIVKHLGCGRAFMRLASGHEIIFIHVH